MLADLHAACREVRESKDLALLLGVIQEAQEALNGRLHQARDVAARL